MCVISWHVNQSHIQQKHWLGGAEQTNKRATKMPRKCADTAKQFETFIAVVSVCSSVHSVKIEIVVFKYTTNEVVNKQNISFVPRHSSTELDNNCCLYRRD